MRKYDKYRHHAWAGLGFLSVFIAIRYFVSLPDLLSFVVVMLLSIYIIYALVMTYLYSEEIGGREEMNMDKELEKERLKIEKKKLKLEKKRIKAELKAEKKRKD